MNKIETLLKELCPNGVEWKSLGESCEIANSGRKPVKSSLRESGDIPYYGANNIQDYVNGYTHDGDYILIAEDGSASLENYSVQRVKGKFWANNHVHVIRGKDKVINGFLFHYFKYMNFSAYLTGGTRAKLTKGKLIGIKIPIPPLEIQEKIVKILDKFTDYVTELTTELTLRQKQYHYYRDKLLAFDNEEVEWKTLNEISTNMDNLRRPVTKTLRNNGIYPYYGASGIVDYVGEYIFEGNFLLVSEDGANLKVRNTPIAFSISGKNWVNNHAHVLKFNNLVTQKFVEYYLNSIDLSNYISGAAQPKLNQKNLNMIKIPHPTLERQEQIVSVLNTFEKLCNDIINGLPKEIELRQKQYEYYRDKLLSFD